MASLDKAGLAYLWSKLKAKLKDKAEKEHSHSEYVSRGQVEEMLTAFAQEYLDGRKIKVLEIDDDNREYLQDGYITIIKEPMYEGEEW